MTKEFAIMTGLAALMLFFCVVVLFFYIRWHRMMQQVLQANKEARAAKGLVDEMQEPQAEKSLPERFWESGGVIILLLLALFPVLYILFKTLLVLGRTDGMKGGIAAFAVILFVLFTVVMAVLGHYEKNPRRRFWMELFPTIALEAVLALGFALELNFDNGYYHNGGRYSAIEGFLLILGIAFAYAEKTRRNWKRMRSAGKTKG